MSKMKRFCLFVTLSMLFVLGCMGMVACGKKTPKGPTEPPAAVSAETIKFDGREITWGEAKDATAYVVECNGAKYTTYSNKYVTTIASTVNEVTIKIIAKNSVGESEEAGKVFTRLKTINAEDMKFDENGVLSWEHVENSSNYIVDVNGKEISNGASNTFSDFTYGASNVIRVKAVGEGDTFSSFGTSVTKTYLAAPSNLKYDGEVITWTGMPLASGYNVYINGNLHDKGVKGSSYQYAADGSEFTIAVQSLGDGKNAFTSKIGDSIKCTKLDEVRNITVDTGVLVWDAVENATSYQVKIGEGTPTTTTERSIPLPAGVSLSISIKPLATGSDFFFSNWSPNVNVYILKAPTLKWNSDLSLDGERQNALYWDNTASAGGYKVKVVTPSGQEEISDAAPGAPHLNHAYLEIGVYEVSVSAVSTEPGIYDSEYSTPLRIQRLAAPKLLTSGAIKSNPKNYEEGFTVNYQKADGANRYEIYREGVRIGQSQNLSFDVSHLLSENQDVGGEINYKIRSIGNTNDITAGNDNTLIKLDSLTANATEFVVRVLPTPTGVSISGNADSGSVVSWNAVSDASTTGYVVKTDTALATVATNSHKLQSVAVGEHSISVCASGNGGNVIASPYSTAIKVRKIQEPTNIRVDTTTDEGKLTWTQSSGAKGYKVYFNGDHEGIDANNMENISNYMKSGSNGVSVIMVASADYVDTDGTYVLSSERSQTKQFTKLNSIVAASAVVSGYELTWRTPDNVSNTASGRIKYKIYDETNRVYDTVDRASLDLSELEGRSTAYTFKIMCVGDGEEFFNSDISDPITLTKLQAVELSVNENKNGYTWTGVANATGYLVKIGSEVVARIDHQGRIQYNLTSDKFASCFAAPGSYGVSVVAVGNPEAHIMDSSETKITQQVKRLVTPNISLSYDKERVANDGNIVATVDTAVANANGYKYTFNGVVAGTINNQARTCTYNAPSAGRYTVIAKANGGLFDESGVFYMDSLPSDANAIQLLDKPSADTIELTRDNILSWRAVSGVNTQTGYTITLVYTDGTDETVTSKQSSYDVKVGMEVSEVRICANGNGKTTISSEFVVKSFAF